MTRMNSNYMNRMSNHATTHNEMHLRNQRMFKLTKIFIASVFVIIIVSLVFISGNYLFGATTVQSCTVTGKSVIVSGGDSIQMVDTDCGSFATINPRTASQLKTDTIYELTTSKGFLFSPDILKSAQLVSE